MTALSLLTASTGFDDTSSDLSGGAVVAFVILGVIYLAVIVVMIWAYVKVVSKAGYSGWWVLVGLIPIANIVVFLLFAFKQWPIEAERNWLRARVAQLEQAWPGSGHPALGQGGQPGQLPPSGWDPGPGGSLG